MSRIRPSTRRAAMRVVCCVLIAASLAAAAALLAPTGRLARLDGAAADAAFPNEDVSSDVVVVGIDSGALAASDQRWPWPRRRYAELIDRLREAGAGVISMDVVFADDADGDAQLADAVARAGNVALGAFALPSARVAPNGRPPYAAATIGPTDPLRSAAAATAQVQVQADAADGVVRFVPLVVEDERDHRLHTSLAAATFALAQRESPQVVLRHPQDIEIAGRVIPTDEHYRMRLSWPEQLTSWEERSMMIPASDVLARRVDPARIAGKTVFVGAVDPTLGDFHVTPVARGGGEPGVLVQAAAYSTIINRNHLVPQSTVELALTVFLVSLIVGLAVQFLPIWVAAPVVIVALPAFLVASYMRVGSGTLVNFVYPIAALVLTIPLSGSVRYALETRQRRRVVELFSQYVPSGVAGELIERGLVDEATRGQRLQVTVLFCDLRGFTAMSATMAPARLAELLGCFYEYASARVLAAGGSLIQYTGDEVFAVFGAPLPDETHAARAVRCAVTLQEEVAELDAVLEARADPPVRFGIGLNAGDVVGAHVGSTWRRQYSVVGETVNVASRMCGRAGPGQVVVSDAVLDLVSPRPPAEPLPDEPMKGLRTGFRAWKLVLERPPEHTHDR